MDWQTGAAIVLAVVGGLWAGWTLVRPFVRPSRADCGLCGPDPELLQIAPASGVVTRSGTRGPLPGTPDPTPPDREARPAGQGGPSR